LERRYEAVLFDLDGTLVDTMSLHCANYIKALAEVGVEITEAEFYSYAGKSGKQLLSDIAQVRGCYIDVDSVHKRKNELYQVGLRSEKIKINDPLLKILQLLRPHYKIALVSGSSTENVRIIAEQAGLSHLFDVMLGGDIDIKGKPHPDLFLKAASLLKVEPKRCLVFEDTEYGIEAAQKAGMDWIQVSVMT